jgi:hypothetical protein
MCEVTGFHAMPPILNIIASFGLFSVFEASGVAVCPPSASSAGKPGIDL